MSSTEKEESVESSFTRFRVYVGIYAMVVVNCIYISWGNLSIYVMSYLHIRVTEGTALNAAWLPAITAAGWGIGMVICHKLTEILGRRCVLVLVTIIFCGSVSITHFTVQYAFWAFILTYGVITGISYGILHALASLYVIIWSKRHVVLATSSIITIELIGGCAMDMIFTWYINPNNFSADHGGKFFSQEEVLDKVPNVFLIYSLISLSFGILAFCLIKDKPSPEISKYKDTKQIADTNSENLKLTFCHKIKSYFINDENRKIENESCELDYGSCMKYLKTDNNMDKIPYIDREISQIKGSTHFKQETLPIHENGITAGKATHVPKVYESIISGYGNMPHDSTNSTNDDASENALHSVSNVNEKSVFKYSEVSQQYQVTGATEYIGPKDISTAEMSKLSNTQNGQIDIENSTKFESNTEDMTPSQVLKSRIFYVLLAMMMYSDFSLLVFLTYYKRFGMEFYSDDHFLSSASLALTIGMCISVNITGIVCEKCDLKKTVLFYNALLCIMSNFFYLSALPDKWLYLFFVAFYGCWLYSVYSLISVCVMKYFGKTHSTTIVGMSLSISFGTSVGMSTGIHYLLQASGWIASFSVVSTVNAVGFICLVFGLPVETYY